MQAFFTIDEAAQILKVEAAAILNLIEQGQLRAIRIGDAMRISEKSLENCLESLAGDQTLGPDQDRLPDGSRWCPTPTGRSRFRVRGDVARGAEMWFGQMRYPLRFSQEFFAALLAQFRGREVRVGSSFSGAEPGSLGAWIQENLPTKMNPAAFVSGLLINEGYAERGLRPGYIRFLAERRKKDQDLRQPAGAEVMAASQSAPHPEAGQSLTARIRQLWNGMPEEVLAKLPADGASQIDHYVYGLPKREQ